MVAMPRQRDVWERGAGEIGRRTFIFVSRDGGGQRRPPCLDTSPLPSSLRRAMQSVTEHLPQIRPRHGEQRGVGRKMWRGGVVG